MQLSMSTEYIKVSHKKLLYLLGLAGRVNFFHSSLYGLCSPFVLKTVRTIQGRFHYCLSVPTQSQGLFCFSHCPNRKAVGDVQESGRGHI